MTRTTSIVILIIAIFALVVAIAHADTVTTLETENEVCGYDSAINQNLSYAYYVTAQYADNTWNQPGVKVVSFTNTYDGFLMTSRDTSEHAIYSDKDNLTTKVNNQDVWKTPGGEFSTLDYISEQCKPNHCEPVVDGTNKFEITVQSTGYQPNEEVFALTIVGCLTPDQLAKGGATNPNYPQLTYEEQLDLLAHLNTDENNTTTDPVIVPSPTDTVTLPVEVPEFKTWAAIVGGVGVALGAIWLARRNKAKTPPPTTATTAPIPKGAEWLARRNKAKK